jgi:ATP-dependent Clp protease adaptor protein ClpS
MGSESRPSISLDPTIELEEKEARVRDLVLYNDDHNTFDYVIEALVEICEHDMLQAEQCTHIVHYNGKCIVKSGTYSLLNPMRTALCDRGLSATIR